MALSFRSMTLGQLEPTSLESLLGEHETLFVEHKTDIAHGDGRALAKAVASFANALGGWVLIGVANGAVLSDWSPPAGDFVDTVRQRLEGNIDPMPAFAAAVRETGRGKIGVVRVYESADTPHLVHGTVYVREPAKDRRNSAQPPYQPTPVRSHYELSQLVRRGADARADADQRLRAAGAGVSVVGGYGLPLAIPRLDGSTSDQISPASPTIALRFAPMTMTELWRSWPVRPEASRLVGDLVSGLATESEEGIEAHEPTIVPRPGGVTAVAAANGAFQWLAGGAGRIQLIASAYVDRAGSFTVLHHFDLVPGDGSLCWARPIERGDAAARLLLRTVAAACDTLARAELLGRYRVHLALSNPGRLFTAGEPHRPSGIPAHTNFDGEFAVDGRVAAAESAELVELTRGWGHELCRAAGIAVWTP